MKQSWVYLHPLLGDLSPANGGSQKNCWEHGPNFAAWHNPNAECALFTATSAERLYRFYREDTQASRRLVVQSSQRRAATTNPISVAVMGYAGRVPWSHSQNARLTHSLLVVKFEHCRQSSNHSQARIFSQNSMPSQASADCEDSQSRPTEASD
jgi:hypothetical protein